MTLELLRDATSQVSGMVAFRVREVYSGVRILASRQMSGDVWGQTTDLVSHQVWNMVYRQAKGAIEDEERYVRMAYGQLQ